MQTSEAQRLSANDDIFGEIAEEYKVKFYKRDPKLVQSETSNDCIVGDFLQNVECDQVIQINFQLL